jgi:hypothetical protein
MSRSRKYRNTDPRQRRREHRTPPPSPRSLWVRAACCGALIAADPARMGKGWADVHEAGCRVPWDALHLDGEPREVHPAAPWLPSGARLRAVNRAPGSRPANPDHAAPHLRQRPA